MQDFFTCSVSEPLTVNKMKIFKIFQISLNVSPKKYGAAIRIPQDYRASIPKQSIAAFELFVRYSILRKMTPDIGCDVFFVFFFFPSTDFIKFHFAEHLIALGHGISKLGFLGHIFLG